jgi:hypothetical protein
MLHQERRSLAAIGLQPFPRPPKPGGYIDSSGDLAWLLDQESLNNGGIQVVNDGDQPSFPDTKLGLARALGGANVLWANTPCLGEMFSVDDFATDNAPSIVGNAFNRFEAKPAALSVFRDQQVPHPQSVQVWLRSSDHERFAQLGLAGQMAGKVAIGPAEGVAALEAVDQAFPFVCKPVFGRGSEGVQLVTSLADVEAYAVQCDAARSSEVARISDDAALLALAAGDYTAAAEEALAELNRSEGHSIAWEVSDVAAHLASTVRCEHSGSDLVTLSFPSYGPGFIMEELLPGPDITVAVVPLEAWKAATTAATTTDAAGPSTKLAKQIREMMHHYSKIQCNTRIGGRCARQYVPLPPVLRGWGQHHRPTASLGGLMPYSGAVPVSSNSVVSSRAHDHAALEQASDGLVQAMEDAVRVANAVQPTAPIRIDMRGVDAAGTRFAAFDLNCKPNATWPGREGRDDQQSLLGMAVEGFDDGPSFQQFAAALVRTAPFLNDWLE